MTITFQPLRRLAPGLPKRRQQILVGENRIPLMSSHLRHCPKHRKPLPCSHCALATKPVQTAVAVMDPPTAPSDASTSAETAQITVDRLMEAVDAAKTNEQVKHALHILSSPKSASAIRGAKWREKQKQQDPGFDKKEAERKATERAEIERVQEIEETLRANPVPLFVMKDAPQGQGLLVTGGYDSEQIEVVSAAHEAKTGRRVVPKGFGSHQIEKTPAKELPTESEDSFSPKFKNPKEVRLLHQFIYENTKKSPMLVCLSCKDQIGTGEDPGEDIMAGLLHFRHKHPDLYKILVGRLKGTACTEDHAGMVKRHGGGVLKVQCDRCRKILYKPPRKAPELRSDKTVKTAA